MSHLKLSVLCICSVLALAPYGQAGMPNLALNPGFDTAPPADPNYVAGDWRYTTLSTGGYALVTWNASDGLTPPCLRMETVASPTTSTTEKGAYQVFSVTPGTKYQVNAKWRGTLSVQAVAGGSHRAQAMVNIDFSTSATTGWASYGGNTRYIKTLDYGYQRGNYNIPYTATLSDYTWDWEDISLSPQPGYPAAYDVLSVPADMTYMRIRFTLATTITSSDPITYPAGASWIEVDNVVLNACQGALTGDIDGDCNTDLMDLAQLTNTWLSCGIAPGASTLCW
jgi:hypothetical protein